MVKNPEIEEDDERQSIQKSYSNHRSINVIFQEREPIMGNKKTDPEKGAEGREPPPAGTKHGRQIGDPAPAKKEEHAGKYHCPHCHYDFYSESKECPNCHKPLGQNPKVEQRMETINPYEKEQKRARIRLVAIKREGEVTERVIKLSGEQITLNREMLDPDNETISSEGHAKLEKKEGVWMLSDCSKHKTTFVKVRGAVKIGPGDMILIGDRMFRFEEQ
jgi:hypothetical protein